MFDSLSSRLDGIAKRLRGKGRLTESDVDEVMREIRTALLEADVNVQVVRAVVNRIREHAIGATKSKATQVSRSSRPSTMNSSASSAERHFESRTPRSRQRSY
jgi:signal recognition particle GTPase